MHKTEIPAEYLQVTLNSFQLGADPEFAVLTSPGDSTVLNAPPYATAFASPNGSVGQDHGGRVWELRPTPARSAYQVLLNIWKLLCDSRMDKIGPFKWKAGALGGRHGNRHDTLGGHVHFGLPNLEPKTISVLASATRRLEDLDVLPLEEGHARRLYHVVGDEGLAYGDFADIRHPGGHVEYRAPSSWLCRPGEALAALTVYKLLVARPDLGHWTRTRVNTKSAFLDWLERLALRDCDARLLSDFIKKRGWQAITADPKTDFKPSWRKDELWQP